MTTGFRPTIVSEVKPLIGSSLRYRQEVDYWRQEIQRRVDEELISEPVGTWFEAMVQRIERRIFLLDVVPPSERRAEEAVIDDLVRHLTCEASRAVRVHLS